MMREPIAIPGAKRAARPIVYGRAEIRLTSPEWIGKGDTLTVTLHDLQGRRLRVVGLVIDASEDDR